MIDRRVIDTWEKGCLEAADTIYAAIQHSGIDYRYSPTEALKVLRSELDHWKPSTADPDYAAMGAVASYCSAKVNCDQSTFDCLSRIEKLIAAKQHDYGHGNIDRFGLFGIVVRISDKLARLENLYGRTEGENQPMWESIADTWDDIVGYCIIALMVLDDTFKLPLEADQAQVLSQTAGVYFPGGATTCIDDIGNAYRRRDDGSWEYLGSEGKLLYRQPEPHFSVFDLKGVS